MFGELKYNELQEACKQRGLSAGGTAEDLTARLEAYEAARSALPAGDDLLGALADADQPDPAAATPEAPAAAAEQLDIADPLPPAPEPGAANEAQGAKVYRIAFPCPTMLTSGLHEENRERAYRQAIAKGHVPRGFAGVRRSGWTTVDGVRHAVYEVPLRRRK